MAGDRIKKFSELRYNSIGSFPIVLLLIACKELFSFLGGFIRYTHGILFSSSVLPVNAQKVKRASKYRLSGSGDDGI